MTVLKLTTLVLILAAAGGCNFLDALTKDRPYFDPRIPIEPGRSMPDTPIGHIGEAERDKYRCTGGAIMVCESWGVEMQCRCRL